MALGDDYVIDARSLAIHRWILCGLIALTFSPQEWIVGLSVHLYHPPPGVMRLFTGFPDQGLFDLLFFSFWGSLACVAIGVQVRIASIVLAAVAVILIGFSDAVERAHHAYLYLIAPAFLSFSAWGEKWCLWPGAGARRSENAVPSFGLLLLAIYIGAFFLGSGLVKIHGGWLDWGTEAARAHLVTRDLNGWANAPLAHHAMELGRNVPWVWEIADWAIVLFELAVVALSFRLRTFRIALALTVTFHVCVAYSLRILFWHNICVYAVFVDWAGVWRWLTRLTVKHQALVVLFVASVVIATALAHSWRFCIVNGAGAVAAIHLLVAVQRMRGRGGARGISS
ncbi:MAG: hypothetical protein CL908_14850 [Deltaproteobacteria bacterium]|nr:hypothetical protein [Deltaproteobacteria bacterium]